MTTTCEARLDEPCKHVFLAVDCPTCLGEVEDRTASRPASETEYGSKHHLR